MTKEEFSDWKRHPVTEFIHAVISDRIEQGKEELALSAGRDPIEDARKSGKLMAYSDFLDIGPEDATE